MKTCLKAKFKGCKYRRESQKYRDDGNNREEDPTYWSFYNSPPFITQNPVYRKPFYKEFFFSRLLIAPNAFFLPLKKGMRRFTILILFHPHPSLFICFWQISLDYWLEK